MTTLLGPCALPCSESLSAFGDGPSEPVCGTNLFVLGSDVSHKVEYPVGDLRGEGSLRISTLYGEKSERSGAICSYGCCLI